MKTDLSKRLRAATEELTALRTRPAVTMGGLLWSLEDMDHRTLQDMATRQGLLLEAIDEALGDMLVYAEGYVEAPTDTTRGWVISQSRPSWAWSKWSKALGGHSPFAGPGGDALIFTDWTAAQAALDHLPPDIRGNFRIYPVVMTAGAEPRTTPPC